VRFDPPIRYNGTLGSLLNNIQPSNQNDAASSPKKSKIIILNPNQVLVSDHFFMFQIKIFKLTCVCDYKNVLIIFYRRMEILETPVQMANMRPNQYQNQRLRV